MDNHVTYARTQGRKSLGLPIRAIAIRAHKAFREMKMEEKRRKNQTSE
jgi:hypothetical protein